MKFSTAVVALAAVGTAVAVPVESEVLKRARDLYKRKFPESKLGKRQSMNVTDTDILNFALNLEYLEANFYSIAAYGTPLPSNMTSGVGNSGNVTYSGTAVPFASPLVQQYAQELALDEMNHVTDLRAALGSAAVAQPALNLETSFTAAAQAAGIINSSSTFSPFASDAYFLLGALRMSISLLDDRQDLTCDTVFEDVGVSAYNGAAPLISSKTYLAAAASILAVEAYHAAAIRVNLITLGQNNSMIIQAANAAINAEGSLDNGHISNITTSSGSAQFVAADSNSLAWSRTPGEVVDIVLLNGTASATVGGFFPQGLNGNITTAAGSGN